MKTVKVYEPEGSEAPGKEHTIPESDLQGFLDNGWITDEGDKPKKSTKPAKADVTKQA